MSKLIRCPSLLALLLLAAVAVRAQDKAALRGENGGAAAFSADVDTNDPVSEEIREIGPAEVDTDKAPPRVTVNVDDDPLAPVEAIINIGKEFWDFMVENAGKYESETDYGTATPNTVKDWTELTGWTFATSPLYEVRFKNIFGATLDSFQYRLHYYYGGKWNHKGNYLAAVYMTVPHADVAWLNSVKLRMDIRGIANEGAKDDPLAAMQPSFSWTVKGPLSTHTGSDTFYLRGDGYIKDLDDVAVGPGQAGAAHLSTGDFKAQAAKALSDAGKAGFQ